MNSSDHYSFTMKKALVGSGYLVMGLLGTCLNLSTLSVLPECEQSLGRPLLIFFTIQLFIGITTLVSAAIPVPYMIATNRPYFVNPLLSGAPGLLICLTLIVAFLFQFSVCMYRSARIVFCKTAQNFFPEIVMQITIGMTFLLSLHITVTITQNTNVRRFSPTLLNWQQSDYEYVALLSLVVYFSVAGFMSYIVSMFELLYEYIYDEESHETLAATLRTQLFSLVCDVIFAILLILPRVDDPSEYPNLTILHPVLNIFGTAVWPAASIVAYSGKVRNALYLRTLLVFKACSNQNKIPSRRNRMMRKV